MKFTGIHGIRGCGRKAIKALRRSKVGATIADIKAIVRFIREDEVHEIDHLG